jgi:cytochrome c553
MVILPQRLPILARRDDSDVGPVLWQHPAAIMRAMRRRARYKGVAMKASVVMLAVLTGGVPLALAGQPDMPAGPGSQSGSTAPAPAAASPSPVTPGKAATGETRAAACSSCHDAGGKSPDPHAPPLTGQSAGRITEQLRLIRSGARNHPVITPPAATLSDQDIDDLAAYYQAQTPAAAAAKAADERLKERQRQLLLQGFKPTTVRGGEMYCRREVPLDSHFPVLRCVTVESAEQAAREGKDTTERLQRNMVGCLQPKQGGCGQ